MAKQILDEPIDVIEQKINKLSPVLLNILLFDNTTKQNLRWATSTYEKNGFLYSPQNEMKPELLIGENINLLTPRVSKSTEEQQIRTKEKGEVFTPAWCCNMMNNYLDEDWFGRKDVFNKETDGGWKTNRKKITFSKKLKKTWREYVTDIRMEITCGEAPYLVSRYDVVKGEIIPVEDRIGILDRKLRIVNENTEDEPDWLEWAEETYKATYGYDFQGDNVLIARENLLYTLVDNMVYKFGHQPDLDTLKKFATIISWNIWQMDGFDYTVPYSEREVEVIEMPLFVFEDEEIQKEKIQAKIKNWDNGKSFEFKEISGGNSKMKFDYIIGNPPYNEDFSNSGDNGNFAKPVYNIFMDEAYKSSDKVELIHPARFLFNAGSTPKEWNEKKLSDPDFKILKYEEDASKVFPNTLIKGGVAVSYRCKGANYGAIEVFTKYAELQTILNKVKSFKNQSLMDLVFIQNRFNLDALYKDHPELKKPVKGTDGKTTYLIGSEGRDSRFEKNIFTKISLFTTDAPNEPSIKVLGINNNKREWRYFPIKYVDLDHENLSKYKVVIPVANGNGVFGEALSLPVIEKPNEAYTRSFVGIGQFNTEAEAGAAANYLKTKFCRTMLSVLKATQMANKEVWKHVPLQDFTSSSDIDWSKSIPEIDQQLYRKYDLSQEEIDFIESHVKEME